jgi:hypothetical protein
MSEKRSCIFPPRDLSYFLLTSVQQTPTCCFLALMGLRGTLVALGPYSFQDICFSETNADRRDKKPLRSTFASSRLLHLRIRC